jgi:N-acetylglutamate synthase-like GNAT family acetyltransferase
MIRRAELSDIGWALPMICSADPNSKTEDARQATEEMVLNNVCFVYAPYAFIGGYITEHWLNKEIKIFVVVLWMSQMPGVGMSLLAHLEGWCKENGINKIQLNTPDKQSFNRLTEMGYKPFEIQRVKEI